jgi:hypothetical protein
VIYDPGDLVSPVKEIAVFCAHAISFSDGKSSSLILFLQFPFPQKRRNTPDCSVGVAAAVEPIFWGIKSHAYGLVNV